MAIFKRILNVGSGMDDLSRRAFQGLRAEDGLPYQKCVKVNLAG